MQPNKNIKIFINYFLGPLLFVWLSYSIYHQIKNQPHLEASWLHIKESFQSSKVLLLIAAIFLVAVNWGLEALKWKWSVAPITKVSFGLAFKAVLTGVSFSVTTPNRVGEYFGRMLYMPEGTRLKSIPVTLVGSLSQLLVTFGCGIIGFMLLKPYLLKADILSLVVYQFSLFGVLVMAVVIAALYFEVGVIGKLLVKWLKRTRHLYLVQSLGTFNVQLLLKLLLLSFLRYLVFVTQYGLVFALFNVTVSPIILFHVLSVVFLAMAIIPSISLVEVGLRGEISLALMGLFSSNGLGIGLTSVTIWAINLVLPAVIGSVLIFSIKVFKKRNEKT